MVESITNVNLIAVDFNPFDGPDIVRLSPATEPQIEIWTTCQFGDDANRSFNESISLRFTGTLNKQALVRAWQDLVTRHEALHSAFSGDGKQICVFGEFSTVLAFHDCSTKTDAQKEQAVDAYVTQDALHVFDLLNGPLVKAGLIKLSETVHHFTLTAHHIVCDGWSLGILLQDLGALYSAYSQNVPAVLPVAPLYSQYAAEQCQFMAGAEYQQIETFWLDQYRETVPVLDLPTDFPRPTLRTYAVARRDYPLDGSLALAVKQLGLKAGCSFVTTLIAAFEVFLYRLTGQSDLVLGLPTAGQSATGHFRLVGHCVNLLPLRSFPHSELSFLQFLQGRKEGVLDAYEHQQLTFGSLLKKLSITRDPARVPMVPVIFNVDMGLDEGVHFAGLDYQLISNPRKYGAVDLFLNISGPGALSAETTVTSLTFESSYNIHLFKEETIDRMMAEFESLLQAVVANPEIHLGEISLTNQRRQLRKLAEWNNTQADYPRDTSLSVLLAQTATAYPDKTALIFNERRLSYRQLDEVANQVAHTIQRSGIGPQPIVGVVLDRSPELIVTLLAILKAGAAYVPIDPAYPHDRIAFMLADSSASMLITSRKYQRSGLTTVSPPAGRITAQTTVLLVETIWDALDDYPKTSPETTSRGDALAYILYTSGSTGQPKGVLIEHRNLVNLLYSMITMPGITKADALLAVTTISFDIAGLELYLPLLVGATLVLADAETTKDGRALLETIAGQNISIIQATPATYKLMLAAGWEQRFNLKILCCGEPLSKDLAQKLTARCSSLWNMYGPTETTIYSTGKQILASDELITIGRPIHNTQVYILDDHLNPVSEGIVGEIYIAGDGVARGYLNRPELTKEKFVPNSFTSLPGQFMYRTGDLGKFMTNGEIQCLGRIDQQVKVRGYRIELGEIEHALVNQSDIKDAVVMAREDQSGHQRLAAYIVPKVSVDTVLAEWQDRWETLYDLGIRHESEVDFADRDLDVAIAEQMSDQTSDQTNIREQADEWLQQSVKRVKALNPQRIMDVGCGAGQLLFELAPDVQYYLATDYAQTAIDTLHQKLNLQPDKWQHVCIQNTTADDFSMVKKSSLDLVLIHSVVQYFPDLTYLLRVIERAVEATMDGGCVFIGDVQGKSTLVMHHAVDQLQRSRADMPLKTFKKTIARRVQFDDEFLADPAFFYLLPQFISRISAVNIQLREGSYHNETTKYHYDVWLYIGGSPAVVSPEKIIDWQSDFTISRLTGELTRNPASIHQVKNCINSRMTYDYELLQLIEKMDGETSVLTLKTKLQSITGGVDPGIFWTIGNKHGFQTHIRWTTNGLDNRMDVVFIPGTQTAIPEKPAALNGQAQPLIKYVKTPYRSILAISDEHIQTWRKQVSTLLPDYMVPTDWVILPALPITPNGKIDRKALPKPETLLAQKSVEAKPLTDLEKLIYTIWTDVLGVEKIGIDHDFFELGGHSMIAVQMMTRLEKETGRRLPLSTLLTYPTVRKLAQLVQDNERPMIWKSLVPIKPQGNKVPIYIIHGIGLNLLNFSSLVNYMDAEQPIYGLQALGLDGIGKPLDNMEDIAAYYLSEVLAQNPAGPYAIGGYSFGGYVALEMARQLKAMGKEVKLLAMFDTNAQESDTNQTPLSWLSRKLLRQLPKLVWITRSLVRHPMQTIHYQQQYAARQINALLRLTGLRKPPQLESEPNYLERIIEKHEIAFHSYSMKPYDGVVDLFKAQLRVYFVDENKYLGWKKYALKGVRVHNVPGDHKMMLLHPNDKLFAETLQRALDNS